MKRIDPTVCQAQLKPTLLNDRKVDIHWSTATWHSWKKTLKNSTDRKLTRIAQKQQFKICLKTAGNAIKKHF